MHLRHLATKSFDSGVSYNKDLMNSAGRILTHKGTIVETSFDKSTPSALSYSEQVAIGQSSLQEHKVFGDIVINKKSDELLPLSSIYDYPNFEQLIEDNKSDLINISCKMFDEINPNTNERDVNSRSFYTPYIPLVVLTGCITPQVQDNKTYFNPDGTVSIAEFLDGLNAIKYGANSNRSRKKTLDKISNTDDYFNEGYQSCIRGISSPFFNLYTRKELLEPITRLELAYITVICWNQFLEKYNNLYGGQFYLGINFDWENPSELLERFNDGFDYKVSYFLKDVDFDIISLHIKDYKGAESMTEYKRGIAEGKHSIPLPMFMSLLELYKLDLFYYEADRLDPLREVSRGELCYFLANLAKLFPINYIN
jgi:hypothetical protein